MIYPDHDSLLDHHHRPLSAISSKQAQLKMGFKSLIVLGLLPHLISVQAATCDWKVNANGGDTCASFAASWGLTLAKFEALNPGVACPGALVAGQSYCVMGTVPSGTTTSTASSTTTTTSYSSTITSTFVTTTSSSSQHQPTQTGLASNCNGFYLVSSGDTCAAIESKYGISAQEFASWNPAIDSGVYYSSNKKEIFLVTNTYRLL